MGCYNHMAYTLQEQLRKKKSFKAGSASWKTELQKL